MADVTRLLDAAAAGDPRAAADLLPLVYAELRQLGAAQLATEKPGQTLQVTALFHEAYLRLADGTQPRDWNSCGHFFAAAAEAMRRILVEQARRKQSLKAGGGGRRLDSQTSSRWSGGRASTCSPWTTRSGRVEQLVEGGHAA